MRLCYKNKKEKFFTFKGDKMTKSKRITYLAILSALVILFQCMATVIGVTWKVVPTLALIPIILGVVILGVWEGTFLGFVFSTVVFIFGISGYDAGTYAMIQYKPVLATLLIFVKGCMAPFVAGIVYKLTKNKLPRASIWIASALCPIVNTLLYCLGMFFFLDFLRGAGYNQNAMYLVFIVLPGVNFLIEFTLNIVLTPAIVRVSSIFDKTLKIGE